MEFLKAIWLMGLLGMLSFVAWMFRDTCIGLFDRVCITYPFLVEIMLIFAFSALFTFAVIKWRLGASAKPAFGFSLIGGYIGTRVLYEGGGATILALPKPLIVLLVLGIVIATVLSGLSRIFTKKEKKSNSGGEEGEGKGGSPNGEKKKIKLPNWFWSFLRWSFALGILMYLLNVFNIWVGITALLLFNIQRSELIRRTMLGNWISKKINSIISIALIFIILGVVIVEFTESGIEKILPDEMAKRFRKVHDTLKISKIISFGKDITGWNAISAETIGGTNFTIIKNLEEAKTQVGELASSFWGTDDGKIRNQTSDRLNKIRSTYPDELAKISAETIGTIKFKEINDLKEATDQAEIIKEKASTFMTNAELMEKVLKRGEIMKEKYPELPFRGR